MRRVANEKGSLEGVEILDDDATIRNQKRKGVTPNWLTPA
jgi:hypothetical protein